MIKAFLMLAALTVCGGLDDSFGVGGTTVTDFGSMKDVASAVATQPDGKIVVAGTTGDSVAVARYSADGTLDAAFGKDGKVITKLNGGAQVERVAVTSDGKIVVAGSAEGRHGDRDVALVCYDAAGAPDAGFGDKGVALADLGSRRDLARGLALAKDGSILVSGDSGDALAVARFDKAGKLDASFGAGGKVTSSIGKTARGYALAVQQDGKIVVAGSQDDPDQGINYAVVRYSGDGKLDKGFGTSGVVTSNFGSPADVGRDLAIQKDGKIVVVGYTGRSIGVVRYTPDGAPDAGFSKDGKVTTAVGTRAKARSVALQPDGKIVVAGAEDNPSQGTNFLLVRYDADGGLDEGFGAAGVSGTNFGSPEDDGRAVALQPDGKIVVVGTSRNPVVGVNFAVARFLGR
ncbi:delta-60 repeat domain-containing protein [Nonomuraea sp. NPDC050556]|uniref:delta-60 repeat domain-containing protein n=1 Tax=Nonomuraea sp. NPDC050556 TaxID=3364369 RepID=UPI0037B4F2C1